MVPVRYWVAGLLLGGLTLAAFGATLAFADRGRDYQAERVAGGLVAVAGAILLSTGVVLNYLLERDARR